MYKKIGSFKESISLENFLDDIKNIYEKEKIKILSLTLSFLGIATLYFFYQLGYVFLYGFYFGGKTAEATSLINMIVNPIPFNFKSITIVGVIILCFYIIYLIPLLILILKDNILKKMQFYMSFLLVIFILYILITIFLFGEFQNAFQKGIYLWILLSVTPMVIMLIMYCIKISDKNPIYFFSNFIYIILNLAIILSIFETKSRFIIVVLVITSCTFIMSLILNSNLAIIKTYLFKYLREEFIQIVKDFFLYLSFVFISVLLSLRNINSKIILIIFILNLILCITKGIITIIIKKYFQNKDPIKENSVEEKLLSFPIMLIYIVCIFSFVTITTVITIHIGKAIRGLTLDNPTSEITYSSVESKSKYNTILGNIVAQKDGAYYISSYPERNLVIIKSTEIKIERYIE